MKPIKYYISKLKITTSDNYLLLSEYLFYSFFFMSLSLL